MGGFVERGAYGSFAVLEDDHLDDAGEQDEHDAGGDDERDERRARVVMTVSARGWRAYTHVFAGRADHWVQTPSWLRT